MKRTRITFDFDILGDERRNSYEKLVQIVCASRWGSGIDIFGIINENHRRLFDFIEKGAIVIDENEYDLQEPCADSETVRSMKAILGKRKNHHVLREMAALFTDEPFEASDYHRNTIYFPNLKAFVRADGMNPEHIEEMLSLDGCDKIILFPYFPLDGKSAYYELTLAVRKDSFVDYLNRVEERRVEKINEEIRQELERHAAGYGSILRREEKSDWKAVEQVVYRAYRDVPSTDTDDDVMEALLVHKLRYCTAFVPELDYVAEYNGEIIGNIMYTHSKVVGDNGEWDTLTFDPISVLPQYQRQGVDSALIHKTLSLARDLGYRAVVIFGNEHFFPRFGFCPASWYGITTAGGKNFPEFMALPLYDGALEGVHGRLICDEIYTTLDKEEAKKLNAKLAEPMNVDEYIDAQRSDIQQFLLKVRETIKAALPDATEKISWQMPTFWRGQNLIHFAAQKNHLGIYLGAEAMTHFAPRLRTYKTSKGAVQFPYQGFGDEQLALISEIADWCGQENNNG